MRGMILSTRFNSLRFYGILIGGGKNDCYPEKC